jgi:hypothetical protein
MVCRSLFVSALVLGFLAASAPRARAEGGQNGTIIGAVFDQSGLPLRGIKVTIASDTEIGGVRSATTNDEGRFRFAALSPGQFELRATADKLRTVIVKEVRVGISAPVEVNVVMEVETATEEVAIVERPPLVETKSAALKEVIDLDTIQAMPLADRNNAHEQLVGNVAGARGREVRGGRVNQTVFTQDGFDMREQFPTMKSSAAYEILTGGHGLEAPTASGAAVNLVTRSGSNRHEFELNATADHSRFRLFADPNEAVEPSYAYVLAPTLAGPILRDRLWFFADYESQLYRTNRRDDPSGLLGPRPPYGATLNKGTFKLTWQVSARNRLSSLTNFNFAREANLKGGAGVHVEAQESRRGHRLFNGLVWESLLSDNQVLRSQIGVTYYGEHRFPARCSGEPVECDHFAPIRQTFPLALETINNERHLRNDTVDIQFLNRYDYFLETRRFGEHALSVRSTFFTEQETDRTSTPGDTLTTYNGQVPIRRITYYSNDPRLEEARHGWFIQGLSWYRHLTTLSDSWRPTRYLTLSLGISHVWAQAGNKQRGEGMNAQAVAPSASVAWDAGHDGRTVLRGSASNYADVEIESIGRHTLGGRVSQNCEWNPGSEAFDRNCIYDGGSSRNTIGLPCGPTGFDLQGRPCRESLRIPRTRELVLGGERELVPGVALALDGIYRKYAQQYDVRETNLIWNGNGTLLMPTGGFRNGKNQNVADLATPDMAHRRYVGVTLGLRKRDGRLKAQSSYTWARLEGAAGDYGDVPAQDPYLYGYLGDDHRHEVKILAQYQMTRWFSSGLRYFWRSGIPYNRYYRNAVYGSFIDNRARLGYTPGNDINDPNDDRPLRLPDLQSFNLQARLNLQPLLGRRVDLYVDILNVLGLRTVVDVNQNDGPNFGIPTDRLEPLRVRLGANFRY